MDYLQKLLQQVRIILFVTLLANNIILFTIWYLTKQQWHFPLSAIMALMLFGGLVFTFILAAVIGAFLMQPIRLLWRNILHVAPGQHDVDANVSKATMIWLGKDLVANLTGQVYQLANVADNIDKLAKTAPPDLHKNVIAHNLPLPLIVLDKDETIIFANSAALKYIGKEETDVTGQNLYSVMDMSFVSEETFDRWLATVKVNSVIATQTWERVRLNRADQENPLQFDLAAYYNKNNPEKAETLLVLFDHTARYTQDDQAVGFVALAVHELRTPITLLRGYTEALDESLAGKLNDAETLEFLHKMKASSQQLAAFVNNILNVARIEGDQLELQLHKENWGDILTSAVNNLKLQAEVRGIALECKIADNLPPVGVDRFSIYEVINNLVDNAIKYSDKGKKIVINSQLSKDGSVETTVQDFGVGIAESVVTTLFNKFQRNYHNRAQISGTGLGLYLSKAIVIAHGGNIWVRSKEGEGATFGFTVLPYTHLAEAQKNGNNEITRSAHGWIKNHSLYRR